MRKQRSGSRRMAALLGFACILGAFTSAEAAVPAVPTISVTPATIGVVASGGCLEIAPCYYVKGTTDASAKVVVTASDAFGKSVTGSTYAAERSDPWAQITAGDYSMSLRVTDLGTHDGTDSAISFTAYAVNVATNETSATSAPFVATKKSTTGLDTFAPDLAIGRAGPADDNGTAENTGFMCGTGYCNLSPCLLVGLGGAFPEPIRGFWAAGAKEFSDDYTSGCTGRWQISGGADDATNLSGGKHSEIKSVTVTVKDASGTVIRTINALGSRRGTQGFWAASLVVADYTVGEDYTWEVVAIDAVGNTSPAQSGSFTRAPL